VHAGPVSDGARKMIRDKEACCWKERKREEEREGERERGREGEREGGRESRGKKIGGVVRFGGGVGVSRLVQRGLVFRV
jgi:hypothetical protein